MKEKKGASGKVLIRFTERPLRWVSLLNILVLKVPICSKKGVYSDKMDIFNAIKDCRNLAGNI